MTSHVVVNVTGPSHAHPCTHSMRAHAAVCVTAHSAALNVNGLTQHHVNVSVNLQLPAPLDRHTIALPAGVNAIQCNNVVRGRSLMRAHVAVGVRGH